MERGKGYIVLIITKLILNLTLPVCLINNPVCRVCDIKYRK